MAEKGAEDARCFGSRHVFPASFFAPLRELSYSASKSGGRASLLRKISVNARR